MLPAACGSPLLPAVCEDTLLPAACYSNCADCPEGAYGTPSALRVTFSGVQNCVCGDPYHTWISVVDINGTHMLREGPSPTWGCWFAKVIAESGALDTCIPGYPPPDYGILAWARIVEASGVLSITLNVDVMPAPVRLPWEHYATSTWHMFYGPSGLDSCADLNVVVPNGYTDCGAQARYAKLGIATIEGIYED